RKRFFNILLQDPDGDNNEHGSHIFRTIFELYNLGRNEHCITAENISDKEQEIIAHVTDGWIWSILYGCTRNYYS
ncbi:hypothetical protein PFISCL1PPCAC_11115, partial [Pristionchus fissidentatus]